MLSPKGANSRYFRKVKNWENRSTDMSRPAG